MRVARLLEPGFRLRDGTLGLGDGGGAAGEIGVVLRELRIERVVDEAGKHLALLDAIAFVHEHLEHPQAFDLGADQNFLARSERARDQHGLDELGNGDAADRHRQRRDGFGRCFRLRMRRAETKMRQRQVALRPQRPVTPSATTTV